jgi:hypothetical protein
MHERYRKWNSVYVQFRRWAEESFWDALLQTLVDLMALPLPTPKGILADNGHDGNRFRENLLMRNFLAIIPPRSNRKTPEHPDYHRYKKPQRLQAHVRQAQITAPYRHPL